MLKVHHGALSIIPHYQDKRERKANLHLLICSSHSHVSLLWELLKQQTGGRFPVLVCYKVPQAALSGPSTLPQDTTSRLVFVKVLVLAWSSPERRLPCLCYKLTWGQFSACWFQGLSDHNG